MSDNKEIKKGNGGKVGAVLGATAGALGTVMANPVGRWAVYQGKDHIALNVHHFFEDLLSNRAAGDVAYNIFNTISNTIIAYPAILPIAGGVIAAGVGALVGRKISKSKLKHQNMKLADNNKKLA